MKIKELNTVLIANLFSYTGYLIISILLYIFVSFIVGVKPVIIIFGRLCGANEAGNTNNNFFGVVFLFILAKYIITYSSVLFLFISKIKKTAKVKLFFLINIINLAFFDLLSILLLFIEKHLNINLLKYFFYNSIVFNFESQIGLNYHQISLFNAVIIILLLLVIWRKKYRDFSILKYISFITLGTFLTITILSELNNLL